MSDEIRVKVNSYGPGRPLGLVYFDPISGKKKAKSAGTTDWREAERLAGELEKELRNGQFVAPSRITWRQFREQYEAEHLASLAAATRDHVRVALNHVERHLNPDRLCKVNAAALSTFQTKLRSTGIRETSIASILRSIGAALRWAESVGMMKAPKINMPKKAKGRKMKGGALLGEQFDRMLAAVPKIRPKDAAEWQRYLNGLWLSGLRLSESVALSWDSSAVFAVDLSGRHPRFRIRGDGQKSGQDELTPMTPDFAEFLLRTPEAERHGRVFRLNQAGTSTPLTAHHVGKVVDYIGAKAGVVVNAVNGKTASAHDLRRSFGTRWAKRKMPPVLRKLMRHANIQTTMQYYVDLDVDEMADDLWATHPPTPDPVAAPGNTSGNISPESTESTEATIDVTPSAKRGF